MYCNARSTSVPAKASPCPTSKAPRSPSRAARCGSRRRTTRTTSCSVPATCGWWSTTASRSSRRRTTRASVRSAPHSIASGRPRARARGGRAPSSAGSARRPRRPCRTLVSLTCRSSPSPRRGKPPPWKRAVLDGVHRALVASGVPETDRFQRIIELGDEDFAFDPRYPDAASPRTSRLRADRGLWSVGSQRQGQAEVPGRPDGRAARIARPRSRERDARVQGNAVGELGVRRRPPGSRLRRMRAFAMLDGESAGARRSSSATPGCAAMRREVRGERAASSWRTGCASRSRASRVKSHSSGPSNVSGSRSASAAHRSQPSVQRRAHRLCLGRACARRRGSLPSVARAVGKWCAARAKDGRIPPCAADCRRRLLGVGRDGMLDVAAHEAQRAGDHRFGAARVSSGSRAVAHCGGTVRVRCVWAACIGE